MCTRIIEVCIAHSSVYLYLRTCVCVFTVFASYVGQHLTHVTWTLAQSDEDWQVTKSSRLPFAAEIRQLIHASA